MLRNFSMSLLLSPNTRGILASAHAGGRPPSLCGVLGTETISYGRHVKARAQSAARRQALESNRLNRHKGRNRTVNKVIDAQ